MKTLKSSVLAITTAVVLIAGSAAANAADKIRIATEGAFPPFNFIDASGEAQGFDVDIANALCAEMKADCEIVTQDWDGIIPALLAKKYDAIVASMSITPERMEAVSFTEPYYSNKYRFVAPEGSTLDVSKEGLKGKTIGAQRATLSAQIAEDMFPDADLKLYGTAEEAYLDLKSGRVDVVLNDVYVSHDWLASDDGKGYAFIGEPVNEDDKIGIAVRKGDDELRQKLNEALAAIVKNGTYEKINAKYFPFSIY